MIVHKGNIFLIYNQYDQDDFLFNEGNLVEEIQQKISEYVGQIIRLYKGLD